METDNDIPTRCKQWKCVVGRMGSVTMMIMTVCNEDTKVRGVSFLQIREYSLKLFGSVCDLDGSLGIRESPVLRDVRCVHGTLVKNQRLPTVEANVTYMLLGKVG